VSLLESLIITLSKLKSSSATCKYKFFGCTPILIKVALGIVIWSLKAIFWWTQVTQAKHCILFCVSMTKSLHITHILSALLQDIPSIALCMSGTLSSSSEVSICGQLLKVQKPVTHKTKGKFVSCKNVTGIPALLIPSLPAEHCCAEDTRANFLPKARMRKNVDIQLKDGLEILD